MSVIDVSLEGKEGRILITVEAAADSKKLSIIIEKTALVENINSTVKSNMKAFEHIYFSRIYFCDPISKELVGKQTPLALYHGKVLIAKVKPTFYDGKSFHVAPLNLC